MTLDASMNASDIEERFEQIAKMLFESFAIQKGESTYLLKEIEFYFYNKNIAEAVTKQGKHAILNAESLINKWAQNCVQQFAVNQVLSVRQQHFKRLVVAQPVQNHVMELFL